MHDKAGEGTQEGKVPWTGTTKSLTALIYVFLFTDLVLFFSYIHIKYFSLTQIPQDLQNYISMLLTGMYYSKTEFV